jgi:hypothetical protein
MCSCVCDGVSNIWRKLAFCLTVMEFCKMFFFFFWGGGGAGGFFLITFKVVSLLLRLRYIDMGG